MSQKERYSLRITPEVISDYKVAVEELPVMFKASSLIEEYMKAIIKANSVYKKTGVLDLTINVGNNKLLNLKTEGEQINLSFKE